MMLASLSDPNVAGVTGVGTDHVPRTRLRCRSGRVVAAAKAVAMGEHELHLVVELAR
jgi:hypothetical protein